MYLYAGKDKKEKKQDKRSFGFNPDLFEQSPMRTRGKNRKKGLDFIYTNLEKEAKKKKRKNGDGRCCLVKIEKIEARGHDRMVWSDS